jgi:hypothetical protein
VCPLPWSLFNNCDWGQLLAIRFEIAMSGMIQEEGDNVGS